MGAGGPIALLLAWLTTANVGLLFAITGLVYFLTYELLHFIYHCDGDSPLRKSRASTGFDNYPDAGGT